VYVSALVSEERVAVVVSDVVIVTPNLSLFIPGVVGRNEFTAN